MGHCATLPGHRTVFQRHRDPLPTTRVESSARRHRIVTFEILNYQLKYIRIFRRRVSASPSAPRSGPVFARRHRLGPIRTCDSGAPITTRSSMPIRKSPRCATNNPPDTAQSPGRDPGCPRAGLLDSTTSLARGLPAHPRWAEGRVDSEPQTEEEETPSRPASFRMLEGGIGLRRATRGDEPPRLARTKRPARIVRGSSSGPGRGRHRTG